MAAAGSWFVRSLASVVLALPVVACSGDEVFQRADTSTAMSEPVESLAPTATTADMGPADGVGVAQTVAPDPAATLLGETGALVPGDQVLVILADGAGREVADAAAAAVAGVVVGQIEFVNLWQIQIPATDLAGLDRAIAAAGAVPGVQLAFPNGTATTDEEIWGTPISPLDDPVYTGPAGDGYRMIGVEQAWEYLRGSGLALNPVHVGITDTGVWTGTDEFDADHVTVRETSPGAGILTNPQGIRVQQPDGTWAVVGDPGGGHGTRGTTILGADPDNGGATGILAPVPQLTVTTTNVFDPPYGLDNFSQVPPDVADDAQVIYPDGTAYTTGAFQGIAEQVRDGARVINMSWGCTNCSPGNATAYRMFFEQMAARHPLVLFVASAGNNNQSLDGSRRYPSGLNLPNMITVGNVMNDGTTAGTDTNTSSATFEVTLAAPGEQAVRGVDVNGQIIDDRYVFPDGRTRGGGTSMAAPQVTAAAALLKSLDPTLTAAQIKQLLIDSANTTITRPDGTQQAIDPGVGGAALAIDEAVRRLISQQLGREVTAAELTDLGTIDAVAVSGQGNDWTVRGIVDACHPACTDITIELQGQGAIGGDTIQYLPAAPDEVSWSVTLATYPTAIIVRRSDNGAGSRILVDRTTLDGHWTGTISLDYFQGPGISLNQPIPVYATFDLQFVTDATGAVTASGMVEGVDVFAGQSESVTSALVVSGNQVMFAGEFGTYEGVLSTAADGTAVITGTWSASSSTEAGTSTGGGTWNITKVG